MQHRYRALTIRWFDWNYNILLLELINSNNNCIEFSCHSFFLFFFWNQKRVFRDYQSLGFKADGLSISIWRHFPRESRVFHDFRSLQRWSTWTLNLVTWRIIGWNQAVLEQRAGVSRKTKAWPVLGFYTHAVALATTLGTIDTSLLRLAKACAQFLVIRYWNEDQTWFKFYAYLIILQFLTFIVWNIVSFICTIIRNVIRDVT